MEICDKLQGGYISKLINIKHFKTENAYKPEQTRMSKINDRNVIAKLKSINPNIDLSNLINEMKCCESLLQKHNYRDVFDSPDTLTARYLLPIYDTITSDLQTLKVTKNDLYQTKRTKMYTPQPTFTPRGNIVPGQTLLISVSLYYPFHWMKGQVPDEAVIPHCQNTIQFYDTQTLQDLKNRFQCENEDSEISGDISENPYKPLEFIANTDLKSALFYINNNIYIDTNHKTTIMHAETMKKWALDHGHPIGEILSMDTQLLDLEVCIGKPYIYQHLGRCEHLFIFNEISFAQSNDCLGQSNYPRVISVAREKLKNCIYCNKVIASIVMISNNIRIPLTVNHMCESCFLSFNYDNSGKKVTDFHAYRTQKHRK